MVYSMSALRDLSNCTVLSAVRHRALVEAIVYVYVFQ